MLNLPTVGQTRKFGTRYSLEDKAIAVEMYISGFMQRREILALTGMNHATLYYWVRQYKGVKQGKTITLKSKV